ncbi:hypothetical protein vBSdyM006_018 [Shigella phage vB_SdyM_006]|nr:hypothetical protein vBSdyM006_018 [Shigella phage vB_SdyM_006]
MNVIFLDIDGVLNSQRSCFDDDLAVRTRLGYIGHYELQRFHDLLSCVDAKVVLISSWARPSGDPKCKEREKEISEALGIDIYDTIDYTGGGRSRGVSILRYVLDHKVEKYVVLDDSIQHYVYGLEGNFIQVNGLIGLSFYDIQLASNILK